MKQSMEQGLVFHEIGTIKVKGKTEPITIYHPRKVDIT